MARLSRRRARGEEFRESIPSVRRPMDGPAMRREEAYVAPVERDIASRIVYWLTAATLVLLLLRLILRIGGANETNGFVGAIYALTAPLVAPFFGMFNRDVASTAVGAFEFPTLIAMAVYGIAGWLIAKLIRAVQGYD